MFRDEANLYVYIKFGDINNQTFENMKVNIFTNLGDGTYSLIPGLYANPEEESYLYNTDSEGGKDKIKDKDTDTDTNIDASSNTDTNTDISTDTSTTDTDTSTDTDTNTNINTDTNTNTDTDTNTNTDNDEITSTTPAAQDYEESSESSAANIEEGTEVEEAAPDNTTDESLNTDSNAPVYDPEEGIDWSLTLEQLNQMFFGGGQTPWDDQIVIPFDVYQHQQGWDPVGNGYFTISEDSFEAEFLIPLDTITDQPDGISEISMEIPKLGSQTIYCAGTSTGPYIAVAIGAVIVFTTFGAYCFKRKRPFTFQLKGK